MNASVLALCSTVEIEAKIFSRSQGGYHDEDFP